MDRTPKSVGRWIEDLAQKTGASRNFIEKVWTYFSSRGISLDSDGTPYVAALHEVFRKEEALRTGATIAARKRARPAPGERRPGGLPLPGTPSQGRPCGRIEIPGLGWVVMVPGPEGLQ